MENVSIRTKINIEYFNSLVLNYILVPIDHSSFYVWLQIGGIDSQLL